MPYLCPSNSVNGYCNLVCGSNNSGCMNSCASQLGNNLGCQPYIASNPSGLAYVCPFNSVVDYCQSVCASNSMPSGCMNSCASQLGNNLGCEPYVYVPPSSASVFSSSSSVIDFASLQASADVLTYVVIAACFLFSFLAGFSAGSR